ncbi:PI3R6 kinase, partial [Amia calva]|nr:PI3R6 kinase [Amia calva]
LSLSVLQSAYIPDDLFKRVYDFCKRLLTLPQPYCTVGLSYTIQIKTERMMPGVLYQRMVIAEQSLKNEQFPYQEKVLVLADPSVFSGDTGAALSQDIESASPRQSPVEYMCSVIQHTIQAALGASCDGPRLAHILQVSVVMDVEQYFQEVVESVERCAEEAGPDRSQYAARLQRLYTDILRTASQEDAAPPHSSPCSCLLPNPEISFLLWKEDDMLWRELAKFVRSGSSSQHLSLSQDFFEGADFSVDLGPEMTRLSIMSNDSGIERDLPVTELPPLVEEPSGGESEQEQGRLSRRNCIRMRPSVSDGMALLQDSLEEPGTSGKLQRKAGKNGMAFPRQQSLYTARIVVLGDDRVLGRLAKAFYSLRKREARRLFLTTKLNLQIYYIPVTDETQSASPVKENVSAISSKFCDLAAYLGRVDPWYESNINSLGHMIPKLVKMQSSTSKSAETDPFLVDVISYYIRMALQPVYFTIYSVKISFSSLTKETVEDVFVTQLEVDFPEFKMPTSTYKDGSVRSKKTLTEICGAVVSVSYRQASLSNRETERGVSLRTSGVLINAIPSNETEVPVHLSIVLADLDCLIVTFCDSQKSKTGMVDASSEFLGNLNVMDAQHQLFFLVLMVVALWEFLAAPLEQTADDGLYEYLDFVDATDRYGKHRVWALLGAAGSVGCIGLLVSSLNCFISGHTPRSAVHFYTHALLIAAAILVAAFLPLYSSRKREPLNQVVRALQLVSAEGRAMLCATTAFLVGAAGAGVDNFLFWEMQDKGSSELFMGSSLAIALLSQFAMSFFSNRVSKVLGQMGTVVFGTVCLALQCLYYSFLWSPWAVLPVQVLSSFSGGALWVALRTQCDDISTPGMERAVQRVFHGLSLGLGAGLGSFAGGFVTQRFGVELLFRATAAALLLWSVGFLIAQSRMPRQKRLNYSRLLVADTSEVSDSESEQERDWLVSAMKDDKCNNIR